MESGIVKMICQMGIFMICAQAILHFRPKAAYEKYLKMLVNGMILIQLFLAIGGIFSPEGKEQLAKRAQWFADSLEEGMGEATQNAFFSEEALQFQVTGEEPKEATEGQVVEDFQGITVQIAPIEPISVDEIQRLE